MDSVSNNIDKISRVCISMITNIKSTQDTIELTKLFINKFNIPVSLLIAPTILK